MAERWHEQDPHHNDPKIHNQLDNHSTAIYRDHGRGAFDDFYTEINDTSEGKGIKITRWYIYIHRKKRPRNRNRDHVFQVHFSK